MTRSFCGGDYGSIPAGRREYRSWHDINPMHNSYICHASSAIASGITITYLCWIRSEVEKSIRLNFLAQYGYAEPWLLIASPREATHDGDRRQILDATPSRNETDATRVVLSQGVVRGSFGPLMSYH
jgi:hypothetical protein